VAARARGKASGRDPVFADAYEVHKLDWGGYDWGIFGPTSLRYYSFVATANPVFSAVRPPPPPPDVMISVYQLANGQRQNTNGLVVSGTPLVIGFLDRKQQGLLVQELSAQIQGTAYPVRADPLKGQPFGGDFIVDAPFTPDQLGSYTVTASVQKPFGGAATFSKTFRVIAAGGDTNTPLTPEVITPAHAKDGAAGVPVTTFLRSSSEP
jgi:hypothetical protein